jgi:hypothetical protein
MTHWLTGWRPVLLIVVFILVITYLASTTLQPE